MHGVEEDDVEVFLRPPLEVPVTAEAIRVDEDRFTVCLALEIVGLANRGAISTLP